MAEEINYEQKEEDGTLFSFTEKQEPETCLGRTFASSDERREYYRNELRKYLKDPNFRAIDGFPLGEDEDIIALSDPPYYCACPNPWIPEFIKEWESQKTPTNIPYKREPFAADVSEGKTDSVYNAHSYHTKVPYKAIMKYVLHYTNPGDIVFDGFCGTGMTGVAAQQCKSEDTVKNLLKDDFAESRVGERHVIQNDLAPVASFITSNYNSPCNIAKFSDLAKKVVENVEKECGWVYKTTDEKGHEGNINYTVWSDVFSCPNCGEEIIYYNQALNKETNKVEDTFECPHCGSSLKKKDAKRVKITEYDSLLGKSTTVAKQVPVLIDYSIEKHKFTKTPDETDLSLIKKIDDIVLPFWVPTSELPNGEKTREPKRTHGLEYVHQFFTKRNLYVLCSLYNACKDNRLLFVFNSIVSGLCSKMTRYNLGNRGNGNLSGTIFVPSLIAESNVLKVFENKVKSISSAYKSLENTSYGITSCNSTTSLFIPSNSIDYIFLDPPFGANINYSELSFIWEAWLKVQTNNKEEAIESTSQGKGLFEYRELMKACFSETYRILKPGHWMTVEFSNTDSSVWNAIQTSLSEVGFIIANVSALDKQQGSFNAVTSSTAVKQDLIISLYKPDETFERQVTAAVGTEAVWTFVRKHLEYLPLTKEQGNATVTVPERDARIIYDRMLSYFVGHNMLIPISSPDFLAEMPNRFVERDGLYYLQDQVQKYDKMVYNSQIKKTSETNFALSVCDEKSAILWVRDQLKGKPMTIGELTPLFMQKLSEGWIAGEKKIELRELLEENFLCYDGKYDVPSQIHGFLSNYYKELRHLEKDDPALKEKGKGRWYIPDPNKAGDLEKIREKALLKEFSLYENSKGKIKEFRIEAIRAGFKKAWQEKNYTLIKDICERMPSNIVEEDEKLLMWYSGALNRLGE